MGILTAHLRISHFAQSQLADYLGDSLFLLLKADGAGESQGSREVQVLPHCHGAHDNIILKAAQIDSWKASLSPTWLGTGVPVVAVTG